MAGLKTIKTKIGAMKKSQTVTKAMEAVSAAKMRKAQTTALKGRAYARAASAVLARLSGSRDLNNHPLTRGAKEPLAPGSALYIVITSDKGLAGALNSGVLRAAAADIARLELSAADVEVVAVGRKAQDYFMRRGYTVSRYYPNTADLTPAQMREIVSFAAERFEAAGGAEVVKIAYQNFVSTFEQRPTLRTVFPLSLDELNKVVGDIIPVRGAFAQQGAVEASQPQGYTLEPGETTVLNAIVPMLAGVIVYHALLESQASEHSARMVAMKSATDKAGELQHGLTLQFNKARQAAITREVSEITGGMEAMAN
jgi:F-type H+-transporting ATPase subunit gamma